MCIYTVLALRSAQIARTHARTCPRSHTHIRFVVLALRSYIYMVYAYTSPSPLRKHQAPVFHLPSLIYVLYIYIYIYIYTARRVFFVGTHTHVRGRTSYILLRRWMKGKTTRIVVMYMYIICVCVCVIYKPPYSYFRSFVRSFVRSVRPLPSSSQPRVVVVVVVVSSPPQPPPAVVLNYKALWFNLF